MKKCTELARFNGRSVVEVRRIDTDAVVQYVVCSNFNNSKAFGSKWDWGHYFNIYGGDTTEIQLRNAMMYLYGMDESEISFDRAKELSKKFLDYIRDINADIEEEYMKDFKEDYKITEDEAEFFGIKDVLFPKKYKIVDVTLVRQQTVTVKVVMPQDVDDSDATYYVENRNDLDDCYDIENEDWEVDDYQIEREDLTKDDCHDMYDSDEIWNDDDFEDL